MNNIEAFILIGGRSSRLGTDKAFVELGGRTLAERAVENIRRGLSPERITMVAGNSTQFAIEAITADTPFIFDLVEGRGPIGGLHAALSYARTPWIFVLACDYPFVSSELIGLLAESVDDEYRCGCSGTRRRTSPTAVCFLQSGNRTRDRGRDN
jgi:molybdopterin-guanine dinucleotide biosynthesis protein A